MVRLIAILCLVCLTSAILFALRPDPWAKAEQKAAQDAWKLADLIESPDRIGWRMAEDISLLRAMIWDTKGERQYPPQGGLTPLVYDFSEDMARKLSLIQSETGSVEWALLDTAGREILYCRAAPAVCLIYDRKLLELTLQTRPGGLLSVNYAPKMSLLLAVLSGIFGSVGIWLWWRSDRSISAVEIVPERHSATRGTLEVTLTPRDLKLLSLLKERDGAVVTKDELYDAGWGRDFMPNSRALDQHMINLRRKLDPDKSRPVLIETVHGIGYRLAL